MDICKFCGMDQNATDAGGYRQSYVPAEEPLQDDPIPEKKPLSPKVKSVLSYVGNLAIGIIGLTLIFPGLTYLGRAMWPLLFGHSINTVKDQGVHFVCAWCLGACAIFSPILLYWAGRGAAFFGVILKEFVQETILSKS